ncbi:MAG: Hsp20/alpha crystallin family protein [Armatimonadota bacterium]
MSMIRWDPFDDMNRLWDQVNQLFEQNLERPARETATATWAPAVDIIETKEAIILRLELPGIAPKELDIQITEETLTIKGERKPVKEDGMRLLRVERQYGPFQRSFTLGMPINREAVTAGYHDGVLEITLPKKEEPKPKQVKIEVQIVDEPKDIIA